MRVSKRIGTKLVASIALVVSLALGLLTFLVNRTVRDHLTQEVEAQGRRLAESIWRSTRSGMLDGKHERIRRTIDFVSHQEGIQRIQLLDHRGRVRLASDAHDEGRLRSPQGGACRGCHAGSVPTMSPLWSSVDRSHGTPVLEVVRPIYNAPECQTGGCHSTPEERRLLGVLDVSVSLAKEEASIAGTRLRLVLFATLLTLMVSVILYLLLNRLVTRPVRTLVLGTRRLAAGDLEHRIPVERDDELGQLARSFNDTTDKLARAQRQLFESEKLASIGRLAAGVAHEINNPLTAILTYASALREEIPPGGASAHRADLEAIISETMRCRDIVRRLLDFARQRPLTRRSTNLNDLVERVAQLLERQASFQRIVIVRRLDPALPRVDIDPNQIHQVLVNLLLNAHDAMPAGGEITLETRLSAGGRRAVLRVIDTGSGIPSPVRARLFEPFFTTKERGTGLGLSVAWGIVQRHAGRLSVESESGKGTTFVIELPVEAQPAAVEHAVTADDDQSRPTRDSTTARAS